MSVVWVYPDRQYRPLGATRWSVVWWSLKPSARDAAGNAKEDWEPDTDVQTHRKAYPTRTAAMRAARLIVNTGQSMFGQAEVQKQAVDWFVEEDRVAEWTDVGDAEIVE